MVDNSQKYPYIYEYNFDPQLETSNPKTGKASKKYNRLKLSVIFMKSCPPHIYIYIYIYIMNKVIKQKGIFLL